MRKTFKHITNKKNRITKKNKRYMKGGNEITIPITSVFLTDPIYKAIIKLNPKFKAKGFKKDPGNQGFILHKINQNQNLTKPINVERYNKNPEYFSIIDGRHRFAKLVARGNSTITVNIIE